MLLMPTSQTDIRPEDRAADQQIPDQPVEVFFSYAHTDERLKDRLLVHFSELLRTKKISAFHPRQIVAGTRWEDEIDARLLRAQIILLLVSADFLNSNYSHDSEVKRAMQRHTAGEARVIPVILRPCDWENSSFGMLQPLPKTRKPVTSWSDRELAYKNITDGIREALENLPSSAYTNTHAITKSSVIPAESPIAGKREAFILEGEFDDFTPEQVCELLKALKQATGKGDIKIRKVEPGSIIVTLEASDETMEQLKALAASGELSEILGRDFRLIKQADAENSSYEFVKYIYNTYIFINNTNTSEADLSKADLWKADLAAFWYEGNLAAHMNEVGMTAHMTDVGMTAHMTDVGMTAHMNDVDMTAHMNDIGMTAHMNDVDMTAHMNDVGMTGHMNEVDMTAHMNEADLSEEEPT